MSETMTLKEKVDILTGAGYVLSYARRGEWVQTPGTRWTDNDQTWRPYESCPKYVSYSDVSATPGGYDGSFTRAYVDFGSQAKGEDQADQSDTAQRSNYRSLRRHYPDVFTDTSFSNVDTLGAYVGNLTPEVVSIMAGLAEHVYYDENDHGELESEEIAESFGQYVRMDIGRELPESHRDTWDYVVEDQEAVFWSAVQAAEYYPDHSGLDVIWDYEEFMPELIDAIESASALGYDLTFDHSEPARGYHEPALF